MFRHFLIPLAFVSCVAATPALADDLGSAATTIGSGSATIGSNTTALPPHAEGLPNPAEHPTQAWNDAKLAKKTSWPLAVWAALAMLGKALAYGAEKLKSTPVVGKVAAWLATGKRAMWVAGIGAIGAAGYNTLIEGGTLVAALVASGVALAGITHSTTHSVAVADPLKTPGTTGGATPPT